MDEIPGDAARAGLTRDIKARALALGFSAVRVAPATEADHAPAFRRWIAAGLHGEMGYMARDPERREDPRRLLPGARSAVVVALNYHALTPDPPSALHGEISRYARGADYHRAMWDRLNALLEFTQARAPGTNGRGFCDTAPVLERDLAAASGLGWIGKNACLITPGVGSWFFLGELLLDIPLEPDAPIEDHCGSCRLCLDSCPTGAFLGPCLLDARRCIAYLTIELKGQIPRDLRPLLGGRIFGCDVCQEVCPHNKWAAPHHDEALAARGGLDAPDLLEILALDAAAFRARFRGTAIERAKRRGLLRNACVALGNAGDARAVPALVRALQSDPEPLVRGHAAWALGRIGGDAARAALDAARDDDPMVQDEIAAALEAFQGRDEGERH